VSEYEGGKKRQLGVLFSYALGRPHPNAIAARRHTKPAILAAKARLVLTNDPMARPSPSPALQFGTITSTDRARTFAGFRRTLRWIRSPGSAANLNAPSSEESGEYAHGASLVGVKLTTLPFRRMWSDVATSDIG
jgi:hypothetical protein